MIGDNVRTELAILEILLLPVDFEARIRIAARPSRQLPEAILFKTEFHGAFATTFQLPLPGDVGLVSRILERISESRFLRIENAEFDVVPIVVFPRHDLDP